MGKRIVVLNGSPRKNGNTATLIDHFTKGAEEAGHEVVRFDLQWMDVHPCVGCIRGGADRKSPCTQKDEMDAIYPAYEAADVIVLASPMYYWSFTAQLKGAIDRLFAVTEANDYKTPRKDCVMLMVAEGDGKENFAPPVNYYKSLLGFLEWRDVGTVLVGGVNEVGDIAKKPAALEEARRLGASIK